MLINYWQSYVFNKHFGERKKPTGELKEQYRNTTKVPDGIQDRNETKSKVK